MYQEINFSSFHDAFYQSDRKNNFSYEGLRHLFDYLEQLEEDLGEKIEFDIVALCCDYSEDKLSIVLENYNLESLDDLEAKTCVINYDEKTGFVLYQHF